MLHFVLEDLIVVDLLIDLASITTLVIVDGPQVLFKFVAIFHVLGYFSCRFSFDLLEFLGLLELSLILTTSSSSFQVSLKLSLLLREFFRKLFLDIHLSLLIVFKNGLEVIVSPSILELILKVSKFVSLLHLELLLELFFLKFALCLVLGQFVLQFLLDFENYFVHLLLFLVLVVAKLTLDFIELFSKLLAFLSAGIQSAGKQLVLSGLVLLHHVLNVLHLVLQFVDQAIDLLTLSSLLFEHVTNVGTLVVGTVDLLLQHSVLLPVDVDQHIFSVLLKSIFELLVFLFAPVVVLFCLGFGFDFSEFLFLFLSSLNSVFDVVKSVHVANSLCNQIIIVFTLQDAFVSTKDAFELCNLIVKLIGFFFVIRGKILIFIVSEQLIFIGVLASN